MKKNKRKKKITSVITKWLLFAVSVACVLSLTFTYLFLYERTQSDTYKLLDQNSHDLINDVYKRTNECIMLELERMQGMLDTANLTENGKNFFVEAVKHVMFDKRDEVTVINEEGKITASTEIKCVGENVLKNDNENYKGAEEMLNRYFEDKKGVPDFEMEVIVDLRETNKLFSSLDGKRKLYYFGLSLRDWSGIVLYGVDEDVYSFLCRFQGESASTYRHIGREGYLLIVRNRDMRITGGTHQEKFGEKFPHPELISDMVDAQGEGESEDEKTISGRADFYGVPSYYSISGIKDCLAVAVYPESEAHESMDLTLKYTFIMEIAVFLVLFIVILLLEKKLVINDIHRINVTLGSITQGDLEAKADVRRTYEFDALSTDINTTVDRLKQLIKEAEQRIDEELALAAKIQLSFIPHEFPPFPDRNEFELYASMIPAKEVGGDFYDYFFVDEDHLAMVMADVSGKGIPAAMFMVMTKDKLRHAVMEYGTDVAEAAREVNLELIKENDAGLFVTVWLGVLTVSTGHVDYVNAGHEYPAISYGGGEFVADEDEHSIPLAARKKAKFEAGSFELSPGDILYLYTDGVTEANDVDGEMFRRSRMLDALNSDRKAAVQDIDDNVRKAIADFVQDAPQFDDTTSLCLRYKGK